MECSVMKKSGTQPSPSHDSIPVPWVYRAGFYAINAFYLEVVWTAIWDLWHSGDLKLRGYSSIWSLIIYGLVFLVVEQSYLKLKPLGFGLLTRGFINTLFAFAIELGAGLILQPFQANSWDYSKQFTYNYLGLIALEYAPLWYLGCVMAELEVDFLLYQVKLKKR